MKLQTLSIVLLLILTASSGCISDSNDNELAGTSWIIIPDFGTDVMEIYNDFGMEIVTIRTFNANGIVEDAMLPTDEECPEFTIMDPNDDSLCIIDAAALDIDAGLEADQKWSIKGNGELILSGEIRMGENYYQLVESEDGEDFCDMMRGIAHDPQGGVYANKYSMSIKLIWLDMENECVMSNEMRMSWELKDGNLLYHTVHPSTSLEGVFSIGLEASCVYGIEWTGQTELSQSELERIQTLSSNCPDPIPDDEVVWDCVLDIELDSLPDLFQQSFNNSENWHPGYPDWCGTIIDFPLALDQSEPNLPPSEDLYGHYDEYGRLTARNETWILHSWILNEECGTDSYYSEWVWDEKYSMCGMEFIDYYAEADSQFIYEVWDGGWGNGGWESYTRYQWQGDYLYLGWESHIVV
mgnify:CR=1 FL=1